MVVGDRLASFQKTKKQAPTAKGKTMKNKYGVDPEAGERTLIPADEATREALTQFEGDPNRALVKLLDPDVTYEDKWTQTTDLLTGSVVHVRRADCGAGCRCAAEVKLASYVGAKDAPRPKFGTGEECVSVKAGELEPGVQVSGDRFDRGQSLTVQEVHPEGEGKVRVLLADFTHGEHLTATWYADRPIICWGKI